MKIALVTNTSWNIYNFRMPVIRALQTQGHEVQTIAPVDGYTHYLTAAGCIHHALNMDSRGANIIKDAALIIELSQLYKKVKPDIVLHYTIKPNVYGSFAAAMLGIPVINNVCGLGTVFLKKGLVSFIAMLLYRISFRFPRQVFFQNQEDLNLFISKNLVSPHKTGLLPGSGIDPGKFYPLPYKRNTQFTFLMIARLIIDKGVLEYIEAIKKLKAKGIEARFQVLGSKDPDHRRGIKSELIDSWIKADIIEYLGTTENVHHYIAQADCVVLPSYREGTPRALLEAASCAKPIVTTDVPGCRQIVTHSVNGLLCNAKDPDDLALKMEEMFLLDDDTLRRFGKNGRYIAENDYDERIVVDKYIHAINNLRKAS
jgi:glycosyltransferase involved in cell wall biosynthesis